MRLNLESSLVGSSTTRLAVTGSSTGARWRSSGLPVPAGVLPAAGHPGGRGDERRVRQVSTAWTNFHEQLGSGTPS